MTDLPENAEYAVRLEVFEGPLDLLLYLIKKDEVDIYDIPIESITKQYLAYIDVMRILDLNIAGDFLVMAATLMVLKSRMLLPVEARPEEEEEDGEDPRWDLVRQLVAYKKYKDMAVHLEKLEESQVNILEPGDSSIELGPDAGLALRDVSIFDLISTFNEILARAPQENLREIFVEKFTVAEKIDSLLKLISGKKKKVSLTQMFARMTSRREMICTFLAILELMKQKHIRTVQEESFNDILIMKMDEADLLADTIDEEPEDALALDVEVHGEHIFNEEQFEEEMNTYLEEESAEHMPSLPAERNETDTETVVPLDDETLEERNEEDDGEDEEDEYDDDEDEYDDDEDEYEDDEEEEFEDDEDDEDDEED